MSSIGGATSQAEGQRQKLLEKQRTRMMDEIQKKKEQISKDAQVKIGADKFVSQHDELENEFKQQTIGLVKLEDFQRIRETVDRKKEELRNSSLKPEAVKKKKKKAAKINLSFDVEGEEDADADQEEVPKKKIKKDPTIDTSFLPDKERETAEQLEREELQKEWEQQQALIQKERIKITCSYWDGSGHRMQVDCVKGDSIGQFLEKCRQQCHQLRSVHVDNLMYIKEDLIIPHHYTFYDFILNKTRGKSGPLFSFDVHDDIRLQNDASVETEESHAGKVIERSWYEKNKHIFPASRWEVFDPQKDYGKYTIKDKKQDD